MSHIRDPERRARNTVQGLTEIPLLDWRAEMQRKNASRTKRQNVASRENPLPGFPRLLTEQETARILGVSPQTLTTWRCTRRYPLRFLKVGHLVRYSEHDVLEFLNRSTVS